MKHILLINCFIIQFSIIGICQSVKDNSRDFNFINAITESINLAITNKKLPDHEYLFNGDTVFVLIKEFTINHRFEISTFKIPPIINGKYYSQIENKENLDSISKNIYSYLLIYCDLFENEIEITLICNPIPKDDTIVIDRGTLKVIFTNQEGKLNFKSYSVSFG